MPIKITDLIQNPIDVERHQVKGERWYSPTDKWWERHNQDTHELIEKPYFKSITTIPNVFNKGVGWDKWLGNFTSYAAAMEYARLRADIGSVVHILIERWFFINEMVFDEIVMNPYLETLDVDFDPVKTYVENKAEIIKYLMSFKQFHEDRKPSPLALEIQLMNIEQEEDGDYKYPWAGTADFIGSMVCKYNKTKFGYCDWKTGEHYPSHILQAISTKILWDSIYPETPLMFLADLYLQSGWRGKPKYTIKWIDFKPEAWMVSLLSDQTLNYLTHASVLEPSEPIKPRFPQELPNKLILEEEE